MMAVLGWADDCDYYLATWQAHQLALANRI